MEYETYADVIDAYNRDDEGYATLTDYIKGNRIKIKEVEMSPMEDMEKILRGGKAGGGIMRKFYALGDEVEEFQEDELDTIELMKDQNIPYGEQVKMDKSGIMNQASGIRPEVSIEEVVKEFIRKRGRSPKSFEEIKDFYFMEMGTADVSTDSGGRMASYKPGNYTQDELDMYEQYKYDMNEQRPGFPVMEIDDFLEMEYSQGRADVQSGGLAGILGV
jgi:hypothetical protein